MAETERALGKAVGSVPFRIASFLRRRKQKKSAIGALGGVDLPEGMSEEDLVGALGAEGGTKAGLQLLLSQLAAKERGKGKEVDMFRRGTDILKILTEGGVEIKDVKEGDPLHGLVQQAIQLARAGVGLGSGEPAPVDPGGAGAADGGAGKEITEEEIQAKIAEQEAEREAAKEKFRPLGGKLLGSTPVGKAMGTIRGLALGAGGLAKEIAAPFLDEEVRKKSRAEHKRKRAIDRLGGREKGKSGIGSVFSGG